MLSLTVVKTYMETIRPIEETIYTIEVRRNPTSHLSLFVKIQILLKQS